MSELVTDLNPSTGEIPCVIAIGMSAADSTAIARLVDRRAVVLVAPDTKSVRDLLTGAPNATYAAPDHEVIERGGLRVDVTARAATWGGAHIELSAREFDLLATLATEAGRVWTFEQLMARIWKTRYLGDPDMVVSTVKRLRRRLADVVEEIRVVSVRGIGFRLVVPDP